MPSVAIFDFTFTYFFLTLFHKYKKVPVTGIAVNAYEAIFAISKVESMFHDYV